MPSADTFQEWLQNRFYGGIADDRFMGVEHSFRYAKGVEIRKNPDSLTLAYKVEAESLDTGSFDAMVNAIVTIASTGDRVAFSNNGKIYYKASGGSNWTNCYTDTGSAAILNAFEYNDYLYWFTAGNVHRIAVADVDADWTGDVTEDYKAFANGNTNAHPAIELANKMYVGDGYYLAELDSLGTWTNNKLEIFNDEEIISLTFGGAMMRLFARKSTNDDSGHKYYWNGTSTGYNERVFFTGLFHAAINDNGSDFCIIGRRPWLCRFDGYQVQHMKRLPEVYDNEEAFFAPNALGFYDNLLTIGTASSGDASIGRGVWTWGREDFKYNPSLNFEYPTSNDNTTDKIGCVHQSNGELFFSWSDTGGTTFGIDKVNTSKYRSSGYLISRVHYGNRARYIKEVKQTSLAYAQLAAGEKIDVYFRKNLGANFEATPELSVDYATVADRETNYKEDDIAADIGNYNMLETKIELTAGTDDATTPELIELSVVYDETISIGDDYQ